LLQSLVMSKLKKASYIKEVRAYYGMTQQGLADFLQVSRALLSLAELGERDLPAEAAKQVQRLYLAINNGGEPHLGKEVKNIENKTKNLAIADAKHKVLVNSRKLSRAQRALAKFRSDNSRATRILASLESLRESASPGERALFAVLADEAEILYKNTGEDVCLPLELRIDAIKAETSFLKTKFKDHFDK